MPLPVTLLATMVQGGRGGIHRYVAELARCLAVDPGIDLTVACLRGDEGLFAGLRTATRRPWPGGGLGDFARTLWAERAPAGGVLHAPSYRRIPWTPGGACVATVHDLAPLHLPEKFGRARQQFLKRVVPIGLRRCTHLLTVTEHTKRDLIDAFAIPPERITVTANGIDHARFRPSDRDAALANVRRWQPTLRDDYVLYTARIEHPGKGHVPLLDAWAILRGRHRDLPQLVFAGAAVERADEVFAHARWLGIDVLVTGFADDAVLPDLYRACRLFVFPSLYEGFGLPPIEAMACGAPVASSRCAALAETAGPAAELDPTSPEQMADVIGRLLDDAGARAALVSAGREWAARFTWEATATATAAVYRQALAG